MFVAAALLASAFIVPPQAPQYQDAVVVHLVDVDVVVTDRRGDPIHGLTAADFELFENGVRKEITHFDEVRDTRRVVANAPAAQQQEPPPARALAIFIDNTTLTHKVRKELLLALRKKAADLTADGVSVMVAVFTDKLHIVCPLSTDSARVSRAIEAFAGDERLANDRHARYQRRMAAADSGAFGMQKPLYARDFLQMERHRFAALTAAMGVLIAQMPGADTKRAVLFVGDGFVAEAEELEALKFDPGQPPPRPQAIEAPLPDNPPAIPTPSEERLLSGLNATEGLARLANSQGITFYGAYGGGLASAAREPVAHHRSIVKSLPVMTTSALASLNIIARSTGGTSTGTTNLMLPVLERVQSDLGSYYVLAYRTESRNTEARKLEIRLKNRSGARVRHRQEVVLATEGR